MECIYVIGPNEAPYKVGYTSNLPDRVRVLQTGHPRPIKVLATAEANNAALYERNIHLALAEHQLTGEWFNCDLDTILDAVTNAGLSPILHFTVPSNTWMDAVKFRQWLSEMEGEPFFASAHQCAHMLGVSKESVKAMQRNGCDRRTALACRALLHRMEPYGS